MNKSPLTLQSDIENVLKTGGGWTEDIADWVAEDIKKSLTRQLTSKRERKRSLRLSSIGQPCLRKLWYSINYELEPEGIPAHALNKFIFGDIIESYLLGLVMAAGHSVEGMQDRVEVHGIVGHRDVVIDGWLFDVKSAASNSFKKFKDNSLRNDDPFGYISQLSSYLYGSQDDPLVTEKNKAGFLVMDKQFGHITVDIYDLTDDMSNKKEEIETRKELCCEDNPPERIEKGVVPQGKTKGQPNWDGNLKLAAPCSYCEFKQECFPELRTFIYSNGPIYLTKTVNEPKVFEVTK